jgi:hypothetical protein
MMETGQDQETFVFNFNMTKLVNKEDLFIMLCDFENYKSYRFNDLIVCIISSLYF